MKTFHSCHLLFDHFQFALIHGPNIPGSYAILLFRASHLASITTPIHNWVLFLLWLYPFIFSGVISPLISSSILGSYWPGEFLFQYPIFLPFHTVHGVHKARILKWFAIPFSRGPHSVGPLHHNPSALGGPSQHGCFIELDRTMVLWSDWLVFCDCGFSVSALWCPLATPTVLLGFLSPRMWSISTWLLLQSAAATPDLGRGEAPLSRHSCAIAAWRCWLLPLKKLKLKGSMKSYKTF